MEKRTRNRILGIIVFVALIIIILPLFQGSKEMPGETAVIASPPFPDQPAAAASPEAKVKLPIVQPLAHSASSSIFEKEYVDEGILKLKGSVWVVQIGSFKNKENALRIVNQLRANGYPAFIHQYKTALSDTTRVYVGPERMQTRAKTLANRIKTEMHLRGIVITYKPLTL